MGKPIISRAQLPDISQAPAPGTLRIFMPEEAFPFTTPLLRLGGRHNVSAGDHPSD
jgi:hypothetical protein